MVSRPHDDTKSIRPPNRELVVYALEQVGGGIRRVHTEDVALKCHELFPDSFSWTRHPALPDKDIVRVALTDARKEQSGVLVEGRSGQTRGKTAKTQREPVPDGWILTEAGLAFLRKHGPSIAAFAKSDDRKDHRQAVLKQLRRIKEHRLFAEYRSDPDRFSAPIGTLADLMRCRVDAPPRIWRKRFESTRLVVAAADSEELELFIERLEQSYQQQR